MWQLVNLRWSYFLIFWKYVDVALIAIGLAAIMQYFTSPVDEDELKDLISASQQTTNSYQNFYRLAAAKHKIDVVMAGLMFMAWIKVRSTAV